MRYLSLLILLISLLYPISGSEGQRYVVVISVDGLIPDYYLRPAKYGLKIPTIQNMCREGSLVEAMETVYPSLTYPSHTTLVTGVRPAWHGIYSNLAWHSPDQKQQNQDWNWFAHEIRTPTLWTEARKKGLTTAAVGWPVTVGAEIDYQIPEYWKGPFDTSLQIGLENTTPNIKQKLMAELPHVPEGFNDELRTQAAEIIIRDHKPNLMLLHLIELDNAHHKKGTYTKEAIAATERIDAHIARIVKAIRDAGIYERTTFIIVSDHGFLRAERMFHPGVLLAKAKFLTVKDEVITDWRSYNYGGGGSTAIILKDPKDSATAEAVLKLFEEYSRRPRSPIYRIVKRDELDKLGANPQAAFFLEAAAGYAFGYKFTGSEITTNSDKACHGHLPSRSELYAGFIASGFGIRKGVREPFMKNLDVAPTVAALLGFEIPGVEGQAASRLLLNTAK